LEAVRGEAGGADHHPSLAGDGAQPSVTAAGGAVVEVQGEGRQEARVRSRQQQRQAAIRQAGLIQYAAFERGAQRDAGFQA
jgi:hypothetical protein